MKILKIQGNRGMTYVELIVVLGILGVLASIVLFNYGNFQNRIEIKNLANDIALKVVQAQKEALSGKLPLVATISDWKPSYGLHFDVNLPDGTTSFVYFTDLNNDNYCELSCDQFSDEFLDKVYITNGNYISKVLLYYQGGTFDDVGNATISFTRPNSGAVIEADGVIHSNVSYVEIEVSSSRQTPTTAYIKIFPSGRIQIN